MTKGIKRVEPERQQWVVDAPTGFRLVDLPEPPSQPVAFFDGNVFEVVDQARLRRQVKAKYRRRAIARQSKLEREWRNMVGRPSAPPLDHPISPTEAADRIVAKGDQIIMPGERDDWSGRDIAPCVITPSDKRRLSDWALIYVDINPNISSGLAATDEDLKEFICGMTIAGSVFLALAHEIRDADKHGQLREVHPTRFMIDGALVLNLARQRGDGGGAIKALLLLAERKRQTSSETVGAASAISRLPAGERQAGSEAADAKIITDAVPSNSAPSDERVRGSPPKRRAAAKPQQTAFKTWFSKTYPNGVTTDVSVKSLATEYRRDADRGIGESSIRRALGKKR